VDVLAKSARSVVYSPGQAPLYNTTGHPAMARGGMGDVLTGFLAAFAAQGMALRDATALGSWLLGRGAELALRAGETEASLSATAVMRQATTAGFAELRRGDAPHVAYSCS
jgi:NAD(P)H-hydrate epimerase